MKLHTNIAFLLVITFFTFSAFSQSDVALTDSQRQSFVHSALTYQGTPYEWGGEDANGMDCSGLILASAQDSLGIEVPRTVNALYNSMQLISLSEVQLGDLLFFDTSWFSTVAHVGIYMGNNEFVHAPSGGDERFVTVTSFNEPYWNKRCIGVGNFTSISGSVVQSAQNTAYESNTNNLSNVKNTVSSGFTKVTSTVGNVWHSVKAVLSKEIELPFGNSFPMQSMSLFTLLIIGFVGIFVLRKMLRLLGFRGLLVVLIIGAVLADMFLFEKQLFVERVLSWARQFL